MTAAAGLWRMVVVFDTNVYRGVNHDTLAEICAAEAEAGVFALGTVWSCLETLAHLGSEDLRTRARAMAVLQRIWRHAGYTADEGRRLRIQEAGEVMLVQGLFDHTPEEPLLELGFVGDMVVSAIADEATVGPGNGTLRAIARRVDFEEHRFRTLMTGWASDGCGGVGGFGVARLLVAAGLVQALAEKYSVPLTAFDAGRAATSISNGFPVAMQFLCDLIDDAATSGSVPGGGNSTWDLKLAFHTGPGAAIQGLPCLLVTDDGRLLEAAKRADVPERVVTFDGYRALLGDRTRVAALANVLRGVTP